MTIGQQIEILKAFKAGKGIQFRTKGGDIWHNSIVPVWSFFTYDYRVSPTAVTAVTAATVKADGEDVDHCIDVMEAYKAGAKVQVSTLWEDRWVDDSRPIWAFSAYKYRVKKTD